MATVRHQEVPVAAGAAPSLIRWGAVFGGAVVGLSLLILITTLWFAIGYGNGMDTVTDNIAWFVAGSAIGSMFIAGIVAGWLSGVPGVGPGFFNGLTVWAISLLTAMIVGVPGILGATGLELSLANAPNAQDFAAQGDTLWAGFISLLVGALTAGIGGMIGGAFTRPAYGPTMGAVSERERAMPVGASDRAYDLSDERAYDRETVPEEERRRRDLERDRNMDREREREHSGRVPPPPRRDSDGWSTTS